MKKAINTWQGVTVILPVIGFMMTVLTGCNNSSTASTAEIKLNETKVVQLVNAYLTKYPHTLLEEGLNQELEMYYPAEQYRQNIKLQLHKVKISDVGTEKENLIPFKVDLVASVLEHRNIDHYPGKLLQELPGKFVRFRIFYYGQANPDTPFIRDTQGRTVYLN